MRLPILLCGLSLLAGCTGTPIAKQADSLVSTLERTGQGSPTVVLQAGLGDDARIWQKIVPTLARDHLVVAINRPGHANVAATDAPRDPCTIADELHKALRDGEIPLPIVLVGHSIGGRYAYVYARRYPEDVQSVVLLDPTPPDNWRYLQAEVPDAVVMLKAARLISFSTTDKREFDDQDVCMDADNLRVPLTMPAQVLVAGQFRVGEKGAYQHMAERLREQWKSLAGVPALQVVQDATHYIQTDAPDAVIAAVRATGK